jgi:hypothetical protein
MLLPAELVRARWQALCAGDFGFVWDSAHVDSGLRNTFPERAAYVDYGRRVLAPAFQYGACQVLAADQKGQLARVLTWQTLRCHGEDQVCFEWGRLRCGRDGWQVLQSARVDAGRFRGPPDRFGWEDFQRLSDMIFF